MYNKLNTFWNSLSGKIRFLIVGSINAALSYLLFVLFIHILGKDDYQICIILQWTIASVFSYITQKLFVFNTKGNYIKEYIKCCITWFIGYLLNIVILGLLMSYFPKYIYINQLFSLFLVAIFTYILFKLFAFKYKK